jgi:hypothetical protein
MFRLLSRAVIRPRLAGTPRFFSKTPELQALIKKDQREKQMAGRGGQRRYQHDHFSDEIESISAPRQPSEYFEHGRTSTPRRATNDYSTSFPLGVV